MSFSAVCNLCCTANHTMIVFWGVKPISDQLCPMHILLLHSQHRVYFLHRVAIHISQFRNKKVFLKNISSVTDFLPIPAGTLAWNMIPPCILMDVNYINPPDPSIIFFGCNSPYLSIKVRFHLSIFLNPKPPSFLSQHSLSHATNPGL